MKQKRQIGILFILITAAALVWAWNFRSKAVTADAGPSLQEPVPIIDVENPHIRMEQIERARRAEYKGSGRNPFSPAPAPVLVAKAPKAEKKVDNYGPQLPPPPPPPPPCILPANVKFYGYGSVNGAARHAFFTDEEGGVQIVGEGDVLLKRFRIIRISNANLEFEEISRGCVGTAPLVEEQPGSPAPGGPGAPPQ
jgi:hypothetical protein